MISCCRLLSSEHGTGSRQSVALLVITASRDGLSMILTEDDPIRNISSKTWPDGTVRQPR
jgi:hypothetical protein